MVFGKLVSGSEKNEQMQQVTDIRNAVLGQELQLSIKEEPDSFCMHWRMKGKRQLQPAGFLSMEHPIR